MEQARIENPDIFDLSSLGIEIEEAENHEDDIDMKSLFSKQIAAATACAMTS